VPQGYDGLLRWIMHEARSVDYRRVTTECLAFGAWLRRFAEAELKAPENAGSATSLEADLKEPESTEATPTSQEGEV